MSQSKPIHGAADMKDAIRDLIEAYRFPVRTTGAPAPEQPPPIVYEFYLHEHPSVSSVLVQRMIADSDDAAIANLQSADTDSIAPVNFLDDFQPTPLVAPRGPDPMIDLVRGNPYAVYNWELFFHIPLTIAIQLSKAGRFAEARQWFHFIFDPTDQSGGDVPQRYWKFAPFQLTTDLQMIEYRLANLGTDGALQQAIINYRATPFSPYPVAYANYTAFMLKTVMSYLDNLIQWGDSLYREDTREAISDALQLYILAAQLLGDRPQQSPLGARVVPRTYAQIREGLDKMSNISIELEPEIPFDVGVTPTATAPDPRTGTLRTLPRLLFCIPHNDRLLTYWDTVADRLFKIRNSLDLQGVFRQLPLFPPPIDPALLVAAAAAGLDAAAIANGALQPLPLVRYTVLAQRASELAQEVRGLSSQLLSAFEKIDGEALALLRNAQEQRILSLGEVVKYGQYQDAIKGREALEQGLAMATERYHYYERLLGKTAAELVMAPLDPLDASGLDRLALSASEPTIQPRDVPIDSSVGPAPPAGGMASSPVPLPPGPPGAPPPPTPPTPPDPLGLLTAPELDLGSHLLSSNEREELARMQEAQQHTSKAGISEIIGALLNVIPSFSVDLTPLGLGTSVSFGGSNIAAVFQGIAATERAAASQHTYRATMAGKLDSYARREMDWAFQSNLAAAEVQQAYKQLRAAQIREAIAEREWKVQQRQIADAQDMEVFLTDDRKGKTTNQAFYSRIKAELRGLHTRAFDLAFDVAAKAERALQYELGDPTLRFLAPTYLAGNEGLLAGDKLAADLKRMEVTYLDRNARELELTKHVSLLALAPRALLELRANGSCTLQLPETLFDIDGPGQYFRRLKSVAVTIPCVAGPYTNVACKLTLLNSSIRTNASLDPQYTRAADSDPRFSDYYGTLESIVTSSAVNDAGLFEVNLRDERYLPFEGHGAISEWSLELPQIRSFDRESISDVILQVRYTARDGGDALASNAVIAVRTAIEQATTVGSVRLFSIRHEFPSEWARFKAAAAAITPLTFELDLDHYPFWHREILDTQLAVRGVELYARAQAPLNVSAKPDGTSPDNLSKVHAGFFGNAIPNAATAITGLAGTVTLYFDTTAVDDLFLAIAWGQAGA